MTFSSGSHTSRPFVRGAFRDLPAKPVMPHPYFAAKHQMVSVDSKPFGRIGIHVATYGSPKDPPILLIHGLMTTGYSFRYVLDGLRRSHYYVVVPDLPGCGRSEDAPNRVHSVAALSEFIGEFQRDFAIIGCTAVGNSLGGYLCLYRHFTTPGAFEKLVALHPPVDPMYRLFVLYVAIRLPGAYRVLRSFIHRNPLRWAHSQVHYYNEGLKSLEEAHEYGDPLSNASGMSSFFRYLTDAMNPFPMRTFVRQLSRGPNEGFGDRLLIVYSDRDPVVPASMGPKVHSLIPNADYVQISHSSHFPHVDRPRRLVALIDEFLR